ncbi:MAG: thymidine phosphorylase [candidate division WOR-3 bacterium]|nr:MAG: thymidine phosphorylase [candidate division WOR-3 bacterium]
MYELILRKRNRGRLSPAEIEGLVAGYTSRDVPDYQMAAWLMAVYFRGMTSEETAALTSAMMNSGRVFDLSDVPGPKVDKHSTGGVGDKVSLILAPLVAACGVKVPMVSGRGLGHTGGTLDKLASIPGFRSNLRFRQFRDNLQNHGCCIMGQTRELCPADRQMYALRDVTATVDSIPLIAASIMSKKLAEGIDGLVLDVKTGTGAFMSRTPQARRLARTMIGIGSRMGKKVVALVTGMWEPLGQAVGNSVEVVEAIEALKGNWRLDLEEVTLALGEEMLLLAGRAGTRAQARRLLMRALTGGAGLDRFRAMVKAQGGDPAVVDDYDLLPRARYTIPVLSPDSGYVRLIDALQVGLLAVELGAGRKTLKSKVNPGVGLRFCKKVGDRVEPGEVLVEVLAAEKKLGAATAARLLQHLTVSRTAPRDGGRVVARLSK